MLLICLPQTVLWCQTCVETDVLSSTVPSPSCLWTICGTPAPAVVVPQLSSSPPLSGALRPATRTPVSPAPVSTSCICVVDLLSLRTEMQRAEGRPPPHGLQVEFSLPSASPPSSSVLPSHFQTLGGLLHSSPVQHPPPSHTVMGHGETEWYSS